MAASRNLTLEQLKARASLAAHTQWANEPDRRARLANAHRALSDRFEREVRAKHPDASPEAIAQMTSSAMKAHMTRLAFLSSKARSTRSERGAS
jgi:hypothetical protein